MNFKYTDFTPIDDRILVQPGPQFKYVTKQVRLEEKPNTKPGKDGEKKATPVTKDVELTSALRVGKILSVGLQSNIQLGLPFKEGDWVVYMVKTAMPFELLFTGDELMCPVLLPRYNILSVVNEDSVNDFINNIKTKEQNEASKEN